MRFMSETKAKMSRKQTILQANPRCYFCGGENASATIDHVPPKACFPDTHFPEGFEFGACEGCNQSTTKADQIFGFYSMVTDFEDGRLNGEPDRKKLDKLIRGIGNNYPDALPDPAKARPIYKLGSIWTTHPIAVEVQLTPAIKAALKGMSVKLSHALYLRETGRILTRDHLVWSGCYHPQHAGAETLSELFNSLLPEVVEGTRGNIRNYGRRFTYRFGFNDIQDFFVYACQFGLGLIVYGIVRNEHTLYQPRPNGALADGWVSGAAGLRRA